MKLHYPIKLNDKYTCQGTDATGGYVTFTDLLSEGQKVGYEDPETGDIFPPYGVVVRREDGLWVEAEL